MWLPFPEQGPRMTTPYKEKMRELGRCAVGRGQCTCWKTRKSEFKSLAPTGKARYSHIPWSLVLRDEDRQISSQEHHHELHAAHRSTFRFFHQLQDCSSFFKDMGANLALYVSHYYLCWLWNKKHTSIHLECVHKFWGDNALSIFLIGPT